MEYAAEILGIWLIHVLAWFTPGPLFVLILRNSLVYSRRTGFWTAVGIALGNTTHILYSIIGVSLLLETNDSVFRIVQVIGAAYLAYLGYKTFTSAHKLARIQASEHKKDLTPFQAAKTGYLTNILSPKASLFFAAVISSFSATGAPLIATTVLGLVMIINSLIMATLLSMMFTHPALRKRYQQRSKLIMQALGILLVCFAALILVS